MPRVRTQKRKQQHAPLGADLENDNYLQQYGQVTKPGKRAHRSRNMDDEEHVEVCCCQYELCYRPFIFPQVLDEKSSRAIMRLALEQQQEVQESDPTEVQVKQSRSVRIQEEVESDSEEEDNWGDAEYDAELVRAPQKREECR
jgi:hypothetical protein